MFEACNKARKSKPPPRCPLCLRTGFTAQECKEYVVTKRDQKAGGQVTSSINNCGGESGGSGVRNCGGRLNTVTTRAGVEPTVGINLLAQSATSVRVCTSLIIGRSVRTPRLCQPLMLSCTAGTTTCPTALSAQVYSRVLARDDFVSLWTNEMVISEARRASLL